MAWSKIISTVREHMDSIRVFCEQKYREIFLSSQDAPFPHRPILFDQAIRNNLINSLILGVLMISIIGGLTSHAHKQYKIQNNIASVWAFKKDLSLPHVIKSSDLVSVEIPSHLVPLSALRKTGQAFGEALLFPVVAQELVLEKHINADINPKSVSTLFTENKAMRIDSDWLVSDIPEVYPNDQVDVLVYRPFSEIQDTEVLIEKALVLQVHENKGKASLTLHLTESQSQALFLAHSLQFPLQIVVHSSSSKPL